MPNFEEVFRKIFSDPQWLKKLLIGSLLCFIPVVNFFAFGYLYRFAQQIRRSGNFSLPEWTEWGDLFKEGLRFLIVWVLYFLAPVLLAWIIAEGLKWMTSGALGRLVYLPFSVAMLFAPASTVAALFIYQTQDRLGDILHFKIILRMIRLTASRLIIPALVFTGIVFTGIVWLIWPLWGFVFFFGFIVVTAYYTLLFTKLTR